MKQQSSVLNAAVGIIQSKSAQSSLSSLEKLQPSLSTTIRNFVTLDNHSASSLTPGDLIVLKVGDRIPADARLLKLQTATFFVDEGSLTGESVTVSKLPGDEGCSILPNSPLQDQVGMIFSGTMVTAGNALAIVTSTGMYTQIGKIQKGVAIASQSMDNIKTPLGQQLDEFGNTLTQIIGVICITVWLISIPKFQDSTFGGGGDKRRQFPKTCKTLNKC